MQHTPPVRALFELVRMHRIFQSSTPKKPPSVRFSQSEGLLMAEEHCHHERCYCRALQASIRHHVRYSLGKEWQHLSGA